MKQTKLICAVPILGVLTMAARWALYAFGTDDRGLLVSGRPEAIVVLALSVCAAVLCFLVKEPEKTYPGLVIALGWLALAFGLVRSQNLSDIAFPVLRVFYTLSRFAGAAIALALAWFAWKQQPPAAGLSAGLCGCFVLRLVGSYQLWSREPQIQNYIFALFACLSLAAFSYQQAALEAGLGSRIWRRRFALLGCFLCFAASVSRQNQPAYAFMGLCLFIQALSPAPEKQP